ncbi:MAG: NEW3 domain-containing protein, partial [Candidatus Thermoplasmatota archaeon]|nr:NEW3 domain-containing protein [Candidatus Thermoplasmatota archaeon]
PTTPTVEVPEDVLMYGDSFISDNNLDSILADLFNSVGEHNSTVKNTAIGLTLEDHWNNINNPGNVWNTSLRDSGHDWDFVVLQDDSRTPAKDRTSSDWIASMQSGILIADEVESEGSEVMLMMTWGYLSGDQSLTSVGLNYTLMQENLRQGYVDYHDNMTTLSREVWIAPVGLGFANIYQSVQESGIIPETPGSAFHSLYDTDGEQPSLKGSYLAACIIYASMTGNLSVETSDMVNLLPAEKLALQQAADDTVFNQTSNISYPWQQSTNPTLFNQQRTIPSGWNLIFADEEVNNLGAESSVQTTIQVSVPSDAAPGYYGYNLFSASTNGNTSSSYTFVIEVVPENDLEFAFLNQESDFFPGQTTTTTVQVSNTGNGELDLTWSITANSGPCVV